MKQLETRYYASLPVVNLTCCPFDGLPLRRTFDPHGVTGFWCQNHSCITRTSETAWRTDNDPWDFDLQPWIDAGKVLWCPPTSGNTLVAGPPEPCPYANPPGQRRPILITEAKTFPTALPDGGPADPWD